MGFLLFSYFLYHFHERSDSFTLFFGKLFQLQRFLVFLLDIHDHLVSHIQGSEKFCDVLKMPIVVRLQ